MTGITTTPHLHFQIDTSEAPFHPYWPYTFQDLRNLKLDFFEAVNVGLGKENAMKYTESPMEFAQNLKDTSVSAATNTASEIKVAASIPDAPQTIITAVAIASPTNVTKATPSVTSNTTTSTTSFRDPEALMSAPVLPDNTVVAPSLSAATNATNAFIDVSSKAAYARATAYLKSHSVSALQSESVFRPNQAMTRREAILYLAGVFGIEPQIGATSTFADVPADDPALGYIATLQAR